MVARSFLRYVLRLANGGLAAIALSASVLAAGPALLPVLPLQASQSAPEAPATTSSPAGYEGTIAYVKRSTGDIHIMAADGTNDRVLWTVPTVLDPWPAWDLAWRPDGRELAFSSHHEEYCSYYQSDVYAIRYDGTGYRRVTNGPACDVLATLPKGSVTVSVANYTGSLVQVYVAGAPSLKTAFGSTMTFDNVADFGTGVLQPAVGIYGLYRVPAYPPFADVQPGQSVAGGNLVIMQNSGLDSWGTGELSWKADGSALAYAMRTHSEIDQIPAVPPYGYTGVTLPVIEYGVPELVAWGPTAATRDQYLYSSDDNWQAEGIEGIYLNTVGDASGGRKLVHVYTMDAQTVRDIEWLPDASGFLFSLFYVQLGYYSDIFEYNFEKEEITQLTELPSDADYVHNLSISPDGQQVVFERLADELDTASSLWIMNRNGSGLHKLLDDAGRPAWGMTPPRPTPRAYLPVLFR